MEAKLVVPPGRQYEVFGERDSVLRRVEEGVEGEGSVGGNEIVLWGTEEVVGGGGGVVDGVVEV